MVAIPGETIIVAITNLVTEIVKGQPPEVKAELWKIYLEDVKWWRKTLGIDKLHDQQ